MFLFDSFNQKGIKKVCVKLVIHMALPVLKHYSLSLVYLNRF